MPYFHRLFGQKKYSSATGYIDNGSFIFFSEHGLRFSGLAKKFSIYRGIHTGEESSVGARGGPGGGGSSTGVGGTGVVAADVPQLVRRGAGIRSSLREGELSLLHCK